MHSILADLSFSYLCSAVEASLDIKKVQMEPNSNEDINVGKSVLMNIEPLYF